MRACYASKVSKNLCIYSKCVHFAYLNEKKKDYRAAGIEVKRQRLPFHIFVAANCFQQRLANKCKWLITGHNVNYFTCYFLQIKCYIFKGGISNGIRLLLTQIPYSCIDQLAFYLTTLQVRPSVFFQSSYQFEFVGNAQSCFLTKAKSFVWVSHHIGIDHSK